MGYSTVFTGHVTVTPPLNPHEVAYLRKFNRTRRMDRERGPYHVEGSGFMGQGEDPDIRRYSTPPEGQPSLWCGWTPSEDGTRIHWDGMEKFHEADVWMAYLIDHFLRPGAHAAAYEGPHRPAAFDHFTFDHTVSGVIHAQGDDPEDRWDLVVTANRVS
ncbi:hypothetical protein [Nocardiopsis sp. FIRDI 009]|uniref:hypothetical protein n=1 Tax=Nocardiopsis sp. FIRDI 009 TaxID=714197 RepID=UPI000E2510BA|nr:hypothetical protein [Nocardiopsis sp. FIRDI 009]